MRLRRKIQKKAAPTLLPEIQFPLFVARTEAAQFCRYSHLPFLIIVINISIYAARRHPARRQL